MAGTPARVEHRNHEKRIVAHGVDQLDRKGPENHPAEFVNGGHPLHNGKRAWERERDGDSLVEFLDQPRAEALLALLVIDDRILSSYSASASAKNFGPITGRGQIEVAP